MKKLFALLVGLTMVAVTAACTVTEGGSSLPVGSEASSEAGSSGVASSEVSSSEVNSSASSGSGGSELEVKSSFSTPEEMGAHIVRCFNEKRFDILASSFPEWKYDPSGYPDFTTTPVTADYSALSTLKGITASYEIVKKDGNDGYICLALNVPDPKDTSLFIGENKIIIEYLYDNDSESYVKGFAYRKAVDGIDLEKILGEDFWSFDFLVNFTDSAEFESIDEISPIAIMIIVSQEIGVEYGVDEINAAVYKYFGVSGFYKEEGGKIVDRNGNEFAWTGPGGSYGIAYGGAGYYSYSVSGDTVKIMVLDTSDPLGLFIGGGCEYTIKLVQDGYNVISAEKLSAADVILTVKSYFSTPKEMGDYIVRCFDEKRFDILAKAFSPSYDIYDYSVLSSLDGIEVSYEVKAADDYYATVYLMLNVPDPKNTAMIAGMNKITLNLHNYGDGFYLLAATREPNEPVDLAAALGVSHVWDTIPFTEFLDHTKLKTFDSTAELTINDIESAICYLIDNPDNLDKVNNAIYEYFGIENYCSMENGLIVDKNGMEFLGVGLTITGINSSRGASYYSYTTSGKMVTIRILATLDPLGLFLDEFVDYTVELSENSYRIISAVSVPVTELLN
ncbi:MAG: hypothetical protein IKA51_03340 [Clostridia bacterium]|nr:hypothetical protein [Clostridia bacterium]